jgi:MerR family transcriptional regulator, copper efflux regulator
MRFIERAQPLGFILREIKERLRLCSNPLAMRDEVHEAAITKVADIDQRITDRKQMKRALKPLVDSCDGHGTADGCPILALLERLAAIMACRKQTLSKPSQNV